MGISPVELISDTEIEEGQLNLSSLPHKQAPRQLLFPFGCHSDQGKSRSRRHTRRRVTFYSNLLFDEINEKDFFFNFPGRIPPPSSRMPSQLEGAMDALITVFYNYSGNDGDKYKLNKGELKQLLNSELTDFLTVKQTLQHHYYVCGLWAVWV